MSNSRNVRVSRVGGIVPPRIPNILLIAVIEIVALAYAASVLAGAIGVSNDRIAEYHYDSPAKIIRR
jgi:hypothetical protein